MGPLVVIRGNSASGKSTTAVTVQRRFAHGTCAVVSQDVVRRNIVREPDEPAAFNIELIEQIAGLCLARGMVVIVEGILDADRYGAMLERLAGDRAAQRVQDRRHRPPTPAQRRVSCGSWRSGRPSTR